MAKTPSKMLPLGTQAPHFNLLEPKTGMHVKLSDFKHHKGLLVMFICNHCPYVKHIRSELAAFCREYQKLGLAIVGINSNDVENYPEDHPDLMKAEATEAAYTFAYLYDESQEVARSFDAACTPDFFLFDQKHSLVYRGQFDESRPGNGIAVSGSDLGIAIKALLSDNEIPKNQKPSLGCNIKWKA